MINQFANRKYCTNKSMVVNQVKSYVFNQLANFFKRHGPTATICTLRCKAVD